MKICWDNLEKLRYSKRSGKWYKSDINVNPMIEMDSCKICGEPYLAFERQVKKGLGKYCCKGCSSPITGKLHKSHTEEIKRIIGVASKMRKGSKSSRWKGGVTKKDLPLYDTYAPQLDYAEKVRRNKEDRNLLEVKCAYCGKWYVPKIREIHRRIRVLDGKEITGENKLYCSNECKSECPIFNQHKYPKGYKKASSREVQPELRQLVFKRDNYICQKCKSNKFLNCHHIEGIRWEPLESADIDKCITYCKKCHIKVHEKEGCKYYEMQCDKKEVKAY